MELKDKVAIVTGASRGIGRQLALELARRGATVVVAARTVEQGKAPGTIGETLDAIERAGGRAIAVQTDVTQREDLKRLIDTTVEKLGRIDILVNNAADTRGSSAPVWEYPFDVWLRQYDTNVHAPFLLMGYAAPHIAAQGGGVIINVTSGAGDLVEVDLARPSGKEPIRMGSMLGYATTKAALSRLTNAVAPELSQKNIAAVALDPGFTRTEFVDMLGERGVVEAERAHPMDLPVQKMIEIITAKDPMRYAGQIVRVGAGAAEPA